jgi:hypothetical protein
MGQQIQRTQSAAASRHWLSMLIEAMEQAAQTDLPESACGRRVPAGLSRQLEQPGLFLPAGASRFSLRN